MITVYALVAILLDITQASEEDLGTAWTSDLENVSD
jgi:hypothetical protein